MNRMPALSNAQLVSGRTCACKTLCNENSTLSAAAAALSTSLRTRPCTSDLRVCGTTTTTTSTKNYGPDRVGLRSVGLSPPRAVALSPSPGRQAARLLPPLPPPASLLCATSTPRCAPPLESALEGSIAAAACAAWEVGALRLRLGPRAAWDESSLEQFSPAQGCIATQHMLSRVTCIAGGKC